MTRYGFVINLDTCSDHRSCMVACKSKTNSFLGSHFIETFTSMSSDYPEPNTYFIPVLCQHCEKPSCIPACQSGVFTKREDGIVAVNDTSKCENCEARPCAEACPYGAIDIDPIDGRIGKCDMCADLVDNNELPACAKTCFTKSIFFGDLDDSTSVVSQTIDAWNQVGCVYQLKTETGNGPAVYYLMSRKEWRDAESLYSPAWHNE